MVSDHGASIKLKSLNMNVNAVLIMLDMSCAALVLFTSVYQRGQYDRFRCNACKCLGGFCVGDIRCEVGQNRVCRFFCEVVWFCF